MIENLTPRQEDELENHYQKWLKIGLSTGPCNKEPAAAALKEIYKAEGLDEPTILFAKGPQEALKVAETKDLAAFIYGAQDASWLAYYDFFRNVVGLTKETDELSPILEFAQNAGWTLVFEHLAVICDHPSEIHVDDLGNLHRVGGPAIRYEDGTEIWAWHGVEFNDDPGPLKDPDSITQKAILSEDNVERRRALVMLYGADRLASVMREVQSDKFGRLLSWDRDANSPELWVEVVNGTPNPFTGNYDKYLIPTDTDVTSAREAVARSYGMQANDYNPDLRV